MADAKISELTKILDSEDLILIDKSHKPNDAGTALEVTHDLDFAQALFDTRKILERIAKQKSDYFRTRNKGFNGKPIIEQTSAVINIISSIKWLVNYYEAHAEFIEVNPYLSVFYDCLTEARNAGVKLEAIVESWSRVEGDNAIKIKRDMNQLIKDYRSLVASQAFKTRLKIYYQGTKRNARSGKRFLDKLFDHHAKLLVIRVDLGYQNSIKNKVTYAGTNAYREQLIKHVQKNYPNLLGYIWKLEYAPEKKYHYHTLFIFNGNKVRQDVTIADQIVSHWAKEIVINGEGAYYNCNKHKKDYDQVGIGMIHRKDTEKRAALDKIVLNYLVKTDHYVKARIPKGKRTFGKSEVK